MNKAFDDINSLREKIPQLKLERMQFKESVEKDRIDKESVGREHQQLVQQMTGQEETLTAHLMEANRYIHDLKVEKQRLNKESDNMQDR